MAIISEEYIIASKITLCAAAFLTDMSKQISENAKLMIKKTIKFIISFSKRLNTSDAGINKSRPISKIRAFDLTFF